MHGVGMCEKYLKTRRAMHLGCTMSVQKGAIAIRATSLSKPGEVHVFQSLFAANKQVIEWTGKQSGHSAIKEWAMQELEKCGYKWELVNKAPVEPENVGVEPILFTFRECVEAIFNGGKVRVTDETPKRVSVFDLIELVTENKNPHMVYERLCADDEAVLPFCEIWKFPGARQRDTPVTTATGALYIVNLLPGKRAKLFRKSGMETLSRFLVGDPGLVEELEENGRRQAMLNDAHPLKILEAEVYANAKWNRHILKSPSMKGKYVTQFYGKPVVYLLTWENQGKEYIKVGLSTDFKERMKTLSAELPGCVIYSVFVSDHAQKVESDWKDDFMAYNDRFEMKNSVKTEFFTGVTIEEAEARLVELCNEYAMQDRVGSDRKHAEELARIALEKAKLDHDADIRKEELGLEKARVELEIIKLKLALKE